MNWSSLVGRDAEQKRLHEFLERVKNRDGSAVLVRGMQGAGTTTLLEWLGDIAAPDFVVLASEGQRRQSGQPFGVVTELVAPLRDRAEHLPANHRVAFESIFGNPAATTPSLVSPAINAVIEALADDQPVLILVDNIDASDCESRTVVHAIVGAVSGRNVGVVIGGREGYSALDRSSLEMIELEMIELDGLSDDDVEALLAGRCTQSVTRALSRLSGGHPGALLEAVELLTPTELSGATPLQGRVLDPKRYRDDRTGPVRMLSGGARNAMLLFSLDAGLPAAVLVNAVHHAGIDESAIDELLAMRLLVQRGDEVVVRHPSFRSEFVFAATRPELKWAHLRLSAVLQRRDDVERKAWHEALSADEPNDAFARNLADASRHAAARGAADAAAYCMEQAAALSVGVDERCRHLALAGQLFAKTGHLDRSERLLNRALALAPDIAVRVDVQLARVSALWMRSPPGLFDQAMADAAEIEVTDPDRAARLYGFATLPAYAAGDSAAAAMAGTHACRLARPGTPVHSLGRLAQVHGPMNDGDFTSAISVLLQFAEEGPAWIASHSMGPMGAYIASALARRGHPAIAVEFATAQIERARATDDRATLAPSLRARAEAHYRTGHWLLAFSDATDSVALAEAFGPESDLGRAYALLALIEANLGRSDDSRRHLELGMALPFSGEKVMVRFGLCFAEASLALANGDFDACAAMLPIFRDLWPAQKWTNPADTPWQADVVEALFKVGRPEDARHLAEEFAAAAERTGLSVSTGPAARCLGIVSNDAPEGRRHFSRALAHIRSERDVFEVARTLLCAAEFEARRGDRSVAVPMLDESAALFTSLGAVPWLRRVERASVAIGSERSWPAIEGLELLAPRELQVALLATRGATSNEIGAELFLSRRTVEHYLGLVYRKLGIHRRAELVKLLSPLV